MIKKCIILGIFLISATNCMAFESKPARRNDQNLTVPAYFVIPLPYSKPGIGEGFVLVGNVANIMDTTFDLNIFQVTGDAGGTILFGEELPLISDWLSLDFVFQNISRADVQNYSKRGMIGAAKDDFNILEVGKADSLETTLTFNFNEKRHNFYYTHYEGDFRIDAIYDNEGVLIDDTNFESSENQDTFKFELDYTDDHVDPRNGLRFSLTYQDIKADQPDNAAFYTLDFNALAYIPIGKTDTLVFNFYRSGAHVNRRGNTNPADIIAELGTNCGTDPVCLQAEAELVDGIINERKYGTANTLGGAEQLRSYPGSRFKGAHSAFFGVEYRWNITQEATPFNYFIWKDIRTGIQAAFFTEAGTVSELTSDLWDEVRYSSGAGIRLITASGGVYRAELATGNEGTEVVIFFNYPWG